MFLFAEKIIYLCAIKINETRRLTVRFQFHVNYLFNMLITLTLSVGLLIS
jgi:hypothetical protein